MPFQTDLILSKKEEIYQFIKRRGRVRTSDVIKFSSSIFHNRGDRDARDLAEEGRIWRIREDIKLSILEYKDSKEEIWSIYPSDR